jgi:hypothetical protein
MPHDTCPPEENVLRAIHSAHCDQARDRDRYSSDLFRGSETSVSRLSVLSIDKLFAIFHRELDSPPANRLVVAAGEINVGRLQEIGREFRSNPTDLTVEEDPTETNPAHAVIPQKISKGLAREIIRSLIVHPDPT